MDISITSVKKQLIMEELSSYQVTFANNEIWSVPLDPDNTYFQAIQKWVKEGNKIEEAD
tara:strand:- start:16 stop:192 length:177 start_codon:yes stop_codon:yes gene_type:complete